MGFYSLAYFPGSQCFSQKSPTNVSSECCSTVYHPGTSQCKISPKIYFSRVTQNILNKLTRLSQCKIIPNDFFQKSPTDILVQAEGNSPSYHPGSSQCSSGWPSSPQLPTHSSRCEFLKRLNLIPIHFIYFKNYSTSDTFLTLHTPEKVEFQPNSYPTPIVPNSSCCCCSCTSVRHKNRHMAISDPN